MCGARRRGTWSDRARRTWRDTARAAPACEEKNPTESWRILQEKEGRCGGPVAREPRPRARREVELVEIAAVRAVVAAEDVEGVLVDDGRVRVARRGRDTAQRADGSPRVAAKGKLVEVVHAARAVEARKDVKTAPPHHGHVPVARRRRRPRDGDDHAPRTIDKVELPACYAERFYFRLKAFPQRLRRERAPNTFWGRPPRVFFCAPCVSLSLSRSTLSLSFTRAPRGLGVAARHKRRLSERAVQRVVSSFAFIQDAASPAVVDAIRAVVAAEAQHLVAPDRGDVQ